VCARFAADVSNAGVWLWLASGRAQLLTSAAEGDVAKVRSAVKRGANLDAVDATGNTALQLAAANGHDAVAGVLLEAGARVDIPNAQDVSCCAPARSVPISCCLALLRPSHCAR
jgi:ankyrin repeat protein